MTSTADIYLPGQPDDNGNITLPDHLKPEWREAPQALVEIVWDYVRKQITSEKIYDRFVEDIEKAMRDGHLGGWGVRQAEFLYADWTETEAVDLPKPAWARAVYNPWDYALKPLDGAEFSGWFPRGRFTIIGGASGSLKTTLLAQALVAGRNGEMFLNHEGGKMPFMFFFCDRGRWDVEETLKRMRFEKQVPYRCVNGKPLQTVLESVEEAVYSRDYPVVVIDGADLLLDSNKSQEVSLFAGRLQNLAEEEGIAFIVTTGSGKYSPKALKDGMERRSIVKGSEVWSRMGGTVFTLNSEGHDGSKSMRRLVVQHRNAPTERYLLDLQDGRLIRVDEPEEEPKEYPVTVKMRLLDRIRQMEAGAQVTITLLGVSKDTYAKVMHSALIHGLVKKVKNRYVVAKRETV